MDFIGGDMVRKSVQIEWNRFRKEARRPSAADSADDGQTEKAQKSEAYVTVTAV